MSEHSTATVYVEFEGWSYPLEHWQCLAPFAAGDALGPRDAFRLADDVWEAYPLAEGGRPSNAIRYRHNFGHLTSWLKLYAKLHCYSVIIGTGRRLTSPAAALPYCLSHADRYISENGIGSLGELADPAKFNALWAAMVLPADPDSEQSLSADDSDPLPESRIAVQRGTRLFWRGIASRFGAPSTVPPVAPHVRRSRTEECSDESKIIPPQVIKQFVNKLGLHQAGIVVLNRYHHLRLCVLVLDIALGRRIDELLGAPRCLGDPNFPKPNGPLERYPCLLPDGTTGDALWFRFTPNKGGQDGSADCVYISPKWESIVVYCVHELIRYGDEVRDIARPEEKDLLILVSRRNHTAGQGMGIAPPLPAEHSFCRVENDGVSSRSRRDETSGSKIAGGLVYTSFMNWLFGSAKRGTVKHNEIGVMRMWNITEDGSVNGCIYDFRTHFVRSTRSSVLARASRMSATTLQYDLNHKDHKGQIVYQKNLRADNEKLIEFFAAHPPQGVGEPAEVDRREGSSSAIEAPTIDERVSGSESRVGGVTSKKRPGLVTPTSPRIRKLKEACPAFTDRSEVGTSAAVAGESEGERSSLGICAHGEPSSCADHARSDAGQARSKAKKTGVSRKAARSRPITRAGDQSAVSSKPDRGARRKPSSPVTTNVEPSLAKPYEGSGAILAHLETRRQQVSKEKQA